MRKKLLTRQPAAAVASLAVMRHVDDKGEEKEGARLRFILENEERRRDLMM